MEAERLLRANQERESALRSLLKSPGGAESADVASLRLKIRDSYEKLVALDPEFAAVHEVEPQVNPHDFPCASLSTT